MVPYRLLISVEEDDATPTWFDVKWRSKRAHLSTISGLLPESRGQNSALTVLYVPWLHDAIPTWFDVKWRSAALTVLYINIKNK